MIEDEAAVDRLKARQRPVFGRIRPCVHDAPHFLENQMGDLGDGQRKRFVKRHPAQIGARRNMDKTIDVVGRVMTPGRASCPVLRK